MEHYQPWSPPLKTRKKCSLPLSAGVLVVGVVGNCLGIAALTAYAVVQAPTLRERFGGYFTSTSYEPVDSLHKIGYTIEIIAVVIGGLLGILTNSLLIYAVITHKRWFLLHWLVYHVFVVAAGLVAAILILLLQTGLYKLYCLIPIGVIFTVIICWVKVYQYFCEVEVKFKLPKCKVHAAVNPGLVYPPHPHHPAPHEPPLGLPWTLHGRGSPGWGGGYMPDWINARKGGDDDVLEFYPGDKLSRSLQERMYESPWIGRWTSQPNKLENTLYCDSDETASSIIPTDRKENDYTTLPAECKLHPNRPISQSQYMYREDYVMEIQPRKEKDTTRRDETMSEIRGGQSRGHNQGTDLYVEFGEEEAQVDYRQFSGDKNQIGVRTSQESRTDSNLTNAEI